MAEYIDREALISELKTLPEQERIEYMGIYDYIKSQPAADVAEVSHGKWLDNIEKTTTPSGITKDFAIGYKCSLCGRTEISKELYCNCGAKMDLGDDEE